MADFGKTVGSPAAAPAPTVTPSSAPAAPAAPAAAPAPVAGAPINAGFRSVSEWQTSQEFLRPTLMTPEGEKFVEQLKAYSAKDAEVAKFSLTINPVAYIENCAGVAITDNPTNPQNVVLLIFADSMQNINGQIPSEYTTRILKQSGLLPAGLDVDMGTGAVFKRDPNANVAATPNLALVVTIDQADYANPEKVMRLIYNKFLAMRVLEGNMTINNVIGRNEALYTSTNIDTVRTVAAALSMNAVPSRADYGCVVYTAPAGYLEDLKRRNAMNMVNVNPQAFKPLLCITGYTTFLLRPQNNPAFQWNQQQYARPLPPFIPLVHFEVSTPTSSLRLSVLATSIAAQLFIKDRLWMTPFNNFSENSPYNLGRLSQDQKTRKFDVVDSQAKLNEYFMTTIDSANPLLVMDVVEGRDQPTGINVFTDVNRGMDICAAINGFFEDPNFMPLNGSAPWMLNNAVWKNYIGTYQNEKTELRDSRELDQLRVAHLITNPQTADPSLWETLTNQPFAADATVKTLKEHFTTLKPLYCLNTVPFAADFTNNVATKMMQSFAGRFYSDLVENTQGFIPVGQFFNAPQNYTGNIFGGAQYTYSGSMNASLTRFI